MMRKVWTKQQLEAIGITEEKIVDRTTHPARTFISWDVAGTDAKVLGDKYQYRYPHVKPESVLIATIGNLWAKNAWWRLQDMMLHTTMAGYSMSIHELNDPNLFSSDAIGFMRWSASMLARDGGVDWLLMVDNDVLLEKDTLLRLLKHDRPVVFPFLEDMEERYPVELAPLSVPGPLEPGHGLMPVRWAAMSCMLFNPRIFNVLEPYAWRGTDFHFGQALNHIGHRIYVDTDTVVKVAAGPSRLADKPYDGFWANHRKMYDRLKHEERDRRPPPGFNPGMDNGWIDPSGAYFGVLNETRLKRNGTVN